MDLPENVKSFNFKSVGENTGKSYEGDFKVKCILNMMEKRLLELEKSSIRGDMRNPTPDLIAYSTILANLRVRIDDGPEWWKQSSGGNTILDESTIVELFDKVMEQESIWKDELKAKTEGN